MYMSTDLGKGHLAMLAASVMWGAMAPVSKYVMSAGLVGSIVVTDVRIFGAAVLFWIFSLFAGSEKVRKKDYPKLFFAGLFAIVCNQGVYITGVSMTSPVDASIITTSLPIVTMIFAAIWLKEPVTLMKAGGVALGLGGALLLVFGNRLVPGAAQAAHSAAASSNVFGDLLCLLAQCSYAVYLVLFKDLISRYSPVTLMKWMFTFASAVMLPLSVGKFISARTRVHPFLRHVPVLSSCPCRAEEPASYTCGDVQLCTADSSHDNSCHLGYGQFQYPESHCSGSCLFRCPAGQPEQVPCRCPEGIRQVTPVLS